MGISSCLSFSFAFFVLYLHSIGSSILCSLSLRPFSQSPILPPHPGLVILLVCCTAAILFSSICLLSPQPYSFISGTGRGYRTLIVAWLLTPVAVQLRALTTHVSSQELHWGWLLRPEKIPSWEPLTSSNLLISPNVYISLLESLAADAESLWEKWSTKAIPTLQHNCSDSFNPNSDSLIKKNYYINSRRQEKGW